MLPDDWGFDMRLMTQQRFVSAEADQLKSARGTCSFCMLLCRRHGISQAVGLASRAAMSRREPCI